MKLLINTGDKTIQVLSKAKLIEVIEYLEKELCNWREYDILATKIKKVNKPNTPFEPFVPKRTYLGMGDVEMIPPEYGSDILDQVEDKNYTLLHTDEPEPVYEWVDNGDTLTNKNHILGEITIVKQPEDMTKI